MQPLSASTAEVRVVLDAHLDGTYWAGASGGTATLQVGDGPEMEVRARRELGLAGRGRATMTVRATVTERGTWFAFVRRDAVDPERTFLVHPPAAPP
jgi:hypothetical protein